MELPPSAKRRPALKHGGARNSAERQSWQLTAQDCRKLIVASRAAWAAGLPFNRFITCLWQRGGIDRKASVRATGRFVRLAREWLSARGCAMPWVWVQEWGVVNGAHCHILLHVPPELDALFRTMPRRWVSRVLGGRYVHGVLQSQSLRTRRVAGSNPAAYEAELMGKLHYMLKCAPAALEGDLDMTGRGHVDWGQSRKVYGKRAAAWQRKGAPKG